LNYARSKSDLGFYQFIPPLADVGQLEAGGKAKPYTYMIRVEKIK